MAHIKRINEFNQKTSVNESKISKNDLNELKKHINDCLKKKEYDTIVLFKDDKKIKTIKEEGYVYVTEIKKGLLFKSTVFVVYEKDNEYYIPIVKNNDTYVYNEEDVDFVADNDAEEEDEYVLVRNREAYMINVNQFREIIDKSINK